jgi:NADPH:quinone reductase-like Zn-dependent oxidoreductase
MGTYALQTARIMGYTIYATASPQHHEYLKTLGADQVFDYKDPDIVAKIITAASSDGLPLNVCFRAAGELTAAQNILVKTKAPGVVAKIASAPLLLPTDPVVDGVEAKFVFPPAEKRDEFYSKLFNIWLKEKLATEEIVPSPRYKIVGGLNDVNKALDELRSGVSGVKLELEL